MSEEKEKILQNKVDRLLGIIKNQHNLLNTLLEYMKTLEENAGVFTQSLTQVQKDTRSFINKMQANMPADTDDRPTAGGTG